MSRVITFSRNFPSYHPRAGEPTYFEERVCRSIFDNKLIVDIDYALCSDIMERFTKHVASGYPPKHHTIRAGHRWKVGDYFSPRVWSGKPYNSKQIQFAPDIQVKKAWDFEMKPELWIDECKFFINGRWITTADKFREVALNDGLAPIDFSNWFGGPNMASSKRKPFDGQIIAWNENIEY